MAPGGRGLCPPLSWKVPSPWAVGAPPPLFSEKALRLAPLCWPRRARPGKGEGCQCVPAARPFLSCCHHEPSQWRSPAAPLLCNSHLTPECSTSVKATAAKLFLSDSPLTPHWMMERAERLEGCGPSITPDTPTSHKVCPGLITRPGGAGQVSAQDQVPPTPHGFIKFESCHAPGLDSGTELSKKDSKAPCKFCSTFLLRPPPPTRLHSVHPAQTGPAPRGPTFAVYLHHQHLLQETSQAPWPSRAPGTPFTLSEKAGPTSEPGGPCPSPPRVAACSRLGQPGSQPRNLMFSTRSPVLVCRSLGSESPPLGPADAETVSLFSILNRRLQSHH